MTNIDVPPLDWLYHRCMRVDEYDASQPMNTCNSFQKYHTNRPTDKLETNGKAHKYIFTNSKQLEKSKQEVNSIILKIIQCVHALNEAIAVNEGIWP